MSLYGLIFNICIPLFQDYKKLLLLRYMIYWIGKKKSQNL